MRQKICLSKGACAKSCFFRQTKLPFAKVAEELNVFPATTHRSACKRGRPMRSQGPMILYYYFCTKNAWN